MIHFLQKSSNLTHTKKRLAEYIVYNIGSVTNMTICALAQASYTSASAISRLCKKAGAANYTEFKIKLTQERENNLQARAPDADIPFGESDSCESIAQKIAQISIKSIKQTNASLNFPLLESAVRYLRKTDIIDIYGEGDSLQEAFDFVNKMGRIGKYGRLEQDASIQAHQAVTSDNTHCAIIISHSGEKRMPYLIAKILKQHSVPIMLITSNPDSPLSRMATWSIWTGIYETKSLTQKLTTYGSQIAVHYILDCIFSFVYASEYNRNRKYTVECEKEIESIFKTMLDQDGK
jgi:DNA-binding MurR/RpiR family transcriptional regulator